MRSSSRSSSLGWLRSLLLVAIILGAASEAQAIPAFARRYGTSCQTCHAMFPKLTPFGEAFRRNGFKFPGKDEDFVKQDQVPLGQEAYRQVFPDAVWPGTLAASAPLALGFNGFVTIHPTKSSGSAVADNGARVTLQHLLDEGHLWAGGTFSEHIAYFGEVTFADGGAEIEHAEVHFNDLGMSQHLVNLYVGRGVPNLTSFAPHSSYIADSILPTFGVTALFGATTDSFSTMGQYNLVEVNGMFRGRFIYSLGANSGANLDTRSSGNATAHVGLKLGGMRLDGEGDTSGDAQKPWAETALTVDMFGYRSASHFTNQADPMMASVDLDDRTYVLGGHVRGTVGSLELNAGVSQEWHNHATMAATGVKALVQYDELSYVVFPWLVPAVRMEVVSLKPAGEGRITDVRVIAGAGCLVRPNLKVTLTGLVEHANAAPPGTWDSVGGFAAPTTGAVTELEGLQVGLTYAF
jgi:hypothetical protein